MKYLGPPQSGAYAAVVASRNQYGQYFRDRVSPIQPGSASQLLAAARVAAATAGWQALTDEQRWAWIRASVPRTGPLGAKTGLRGFSYYVRVNLSINGPAGSVTDPPAISGASLSGFSVTSNASHDLIVHADTPAHAWIYATAPLSAGSMAAPGRKLSSGAPAYFRRITAIPAAGWPNDIKSPYGSAYSALGGGERIWVEAREILPHGLGVRQRGFVVIG